jgi:glycosyltransferase involved in cell wall biosynthesis
MSPIVSVIIPAYNAENYILNTLNSVLVQTYKNIEIIIIDDGSTDNTLKLIQPYESEKIKIITQKNLGASAARNNGIKCASGKYIQFLDADDLINNVKIEYQVKLLILNADHLSLCHTVHFNNEADPFLIPINHEWFSEGSDNPVDFLIKLYGGGLVGSGYGGMIQPNAWLTPKKIIDEIGFWNEMKNPDDDGEFFCRALLASKGVVYSFESINYYRKFKTNLNLSAQNGYEHSLNLLISTELKAKYLLEKTDDFRAKIALSRLFWENAFDFYLIYNDLFLRAKQNALKLAPDLKYNNYHTGIPHYLSKIIGWKAVKMLKKIKSRLYILNIK